MLRITQDVNISEGEGEFLQDFRVLGASENFQYLFFLMILNFIPLLNIIVIPHKSIKITNFIILSIKDFLAKDLDKNITKPTLVDFIILLI